MFSTIFAINRRIVLNFTASLMIILVIRMAVTLVITIPSFSVIYKNFLTLSPTAADSHSRSSGHYCNGKYTIFFCDFPDLLTCPTFDSTDCNLYFYALFFYNYGSK